jgi:uncharacterized protein YihD (DUF1040 family)
MMLELIIVFALGVALGSFAASRLHENTMVELLERLNVTDRDLERVVKGLQEDQDQELPSVEVRVEQVDDQLYVYRLDTMEFLCQGADREAVVACLADRFHKDFKISISEEHGARYLKESPTS